MSNLKSLAHLSRSLTLAHTAAAARLTTIRRIWRKRKSLKRAPYHWQWNHITVSLITSNRGMVAQTNTDSNKPQQPCGLVVVWTKWNSSTQLPLIKSIFFVSAFASCHTTAMHTPFSLPLRFLSSKNRFFCPLAGLYSRFGQFFSSKRERKRAQCMWQ